MSLMTAYSPLAEAILKALSLQDQHVRELHLHMVAGEIVTVDVVLYTEEPDPASEAALLTELRRYELHPVAEQELER